MENEIWEPIKGYEGLYEVSDLGRVRSLERLDALGRWTKTRILRLSKNQQGYPKVRLFKDNKGKTYPVHKLVAIMFLPNPDNLPQIDHINTKRDDARLCNLRWCTAKQNCNNPISIQHYKNVPRLPIPARCKPVYQIKDGIVIAEFHSTRAASIAVGGSRRNITMALRGIYKRSYGYEWKYKE